LLSDSTKGFVLVALSILLLQLSMEMMQNHDDAEREYQTACDLEYRALMGNISMPDWELCNELDQHRSRKAALFMITLASFVITGLVGTVMILPSNED